MLARYLVEDKTLRLSDQGCVNAFCNNDDKVDGDDLTWILMLIARLITE